MSRAADQTYVARVAACAVGLAFAGRDEHEAVDELVSMAEDETGVLTAAGREIAGLEHLEEALRSRAATLLDASTRALAQRAAVTGPSSQGTTPPAHIAPQDDGATSPLSAVVATASQPPAGQEER